jgi:DNA-binding CsgD family transcriptional regulator
MATAAAADLFTMSALSRIQEHLDQAATVPDLFGVAAREARTACGYARALVVDVDEGTLSAQVTRPLAPESEELRVQMLARPVRVSAPSREAGLLRGDKRRLASAPSVLETQLGLDQPGLAPIVADGTTVALLVADRPSHAGNDPETLLCLVAHLVGCSLTKLVLRARLEELSIELRYLTTSATALLHEARHAPIQVPRDRGSGPTFHHGATVPAAPGSIDYGLSSREAEVLDLMARGMGNREIAEHMNLSVETIKGYVRRVFRKLGAVNRVDAVRRHLQSLGE